LADSSNDSCALRGPGTNAGTSADYGYYGTGNGFSTAYVAGGATRSQLRTQVLSNGNIIWDFAGSLWEWTDMWCDTTSWTNTGWVEWSNASVTDWGKLVGGPSGALTSANGVGTTSGCNGNGNPMRRGASWADGNGSGIYATAMDTSAAGVHGRYGFRCAYSNVH
jgi:hypothetical protein